MNIITGYMGTPHITSAQDRGQNQGCFGTGSYILDVGQQLAAEIVSANEIRIRDGVLSHQGCVGIIEQGAYDSLEIANGSQGMQRIDLIVARYEKNTETSVESLNIVVIEGTAAASNPTAPTYNEGDIQAGDSPVDMPLYQVNIDGVNIASTTLVASKVQTQAELQSAVSELNSNLENIGDYKTASGESTISIASGTTRSICSVTLDAGIWIITGQVAFQAGGNVSGYRCAYLGTSNTGNQVANAQVPGTNANTSVIVAGLWSASQGQTIYLNALQGSGSALNVVGTSCKLKAARIK